MAKDLQSEGAERARPAKLLLLGDVMTGRGIDQILAHPGNPTLHEEHVKDAGEYVVLAENANGPLPRGVDPAYIWGDALALMEQAAPDVRIVNLETSVTTSNDFWKWKEVHYRMHPLNIGCLSVAKIDVCSLANNHVLDWGYQGLEETLLTLDRAKISRAGAGRNLRDAAAPAIAKLRETGRVIVFSYGSPTSGVRLNWGATEERPGVNLLSDFSELTVRRIRSRIGDIKGEGDIVVFSLHWGGNWGYEIHREEIQFAHDLVEAGVDVVHGHSSHHVKGIEVYRDRLILYGAGDFLNDYEGIGGYEQYRNDLGLMYIPSLDRSTGRLLGLEMNPTRIRNFRVNRASPGEAQWLENVLTREGKRFGTEARTSNRNTLTLAW